MKILIISDSPLKQTGYGRQVRELHKIFTDLGNTVVFLGMHSEIEGTQMQDYNGSKVYAMQGPLDMSGQWMGPDKHWIQSACLIEKPDLAIIVWDLRKVIGIVRDFDRFFLCPVYLYWLFDSEPISHQYIELMKTTMVRILPVSECITDWLNKVGIPYDWHPIPEPVDLTKFYPLPEETRARVRTIYLGENAEKVCFGFVGGNFQRKNIPFLIDAFAALPPEIQADSVLLLHTDPRAHERNMTSYDIPGIIRAYYPYLIDQIIYSQANNDIGFNMCEVYNVMDWQVSASTGEGWGLCTVEGMACGVPMIIGDISTTGEILGDTGIIVPVSSYFHAPNPYLRVTLPDFALFVQAMIDAYRYTRAIDPALKFPEWDIRSKKGKSGEPRHFGDLEIIAQASKFSMEKVEGLWAEFFQYLSTVAFPTQLLGWHDIHPNEPLLVTGAKE